MHETKLDNEPSEKPSAAPVAKSNIDKEDLDLDIDIDADFSSGILQPIVSASYKY